MQLRLAAGRPLDEEMLLLAGLERIEYVMVNPETRDLLIAGPAGDWQIGPEERIVAPRSGRPVVRLDDLFVVLRHVLASSDMRFGCSITPTQDALARAQQFVADSDARPIAAGKRGTWLKQLRDSLGGRTVEVQGIDPPNARCPGAGRGRLPDEARGHRPGARHTGSAQLSGYDLGTAGRAAAGHERAALVVHVELPVGSGKPRAAGVSTTRAGREGAQRKRAAQRAGRRVHTGQSDLLNQQFADNFTAHFADLAARYPVYAELQNIFDLALVSALIKSEGLAEQVGWHMAWLKDPRQYRVSLGHAPRIGRNGSQPSSGEPSARAGGRERRRECRSRSACAARGDSRRPIEVRLSIDARAAKRRSLVVGLNKRGVGVPGCS